jgi:triphosphoribosyl-dephospho-CoA synthase
MVLLLAPLAAVPELVDLADGVARVITATTVDDAQHVYRAIRLAQPGGLGTVPEQDVTEAPTITLRDAMAMAADRDSVARQYANGYQEVFHEALPALRQALAAGRDVETAIVATHLRLMANHPDSLIARKYGQVRAAEVSARAAEILGAGWPDCVAPWDQIDVFDTWLRHPAHRFNPGTTADLVTAALYVAIRDGTILGTSISTQGVALG